MPWVVPQAFPRDEGGGEMEEAVRRRHRLGRQPGLSTRLRWLMFKKDFGNAAGEMLRRDRPKRRLPLRREGTGRPRGEKLGREALPVRNPFPAWPGGFYLPKSHWWQKPNWFWGGKRVLPPPGHPERWVLGRGTQFWGGGQGGTGKGSEPWWHLVAPGAVRAGMLVASW